MRFLFTTVIVILTNAFCLLSEAGPNFDFDKYKFNKLDSAIKENDEFNMQKSLHIIFFSNSTSNYHEKWLECSRIFLENGRAMAGIICYKRISELLSNIEKGKIKEEGLEEVAKFCSKYFTDISEGACDSLVIMDFYNVKDDEFFEFIVRYSYPISQNDAYKKIERAHNKKHTLAFKSKNNKKDIKKLLFDENSVPPMADIEKVYSNVVYPDIAVRAGIEGRVIVMVLIDERGNI